MTKRSASEMSRAMVPANYKGFRPARVTKGGGPWGNRQKVTAEDWVLIPPNEIKRVMDMVDNTPYLFLCLSKITNALCGKGISMSLKEFGREVDLGETHAKLIKTEWGKKFYPKLVRYLWGMGVVPVRIIPHPDRRYQGTRIPFVPPYTKWELRFSESSSGTRQYWIHYLDDNESFESDESGMQLNENNAGYPLPDGGVSHLIFAMPEFEPNETGVLRSPMRYAGEEYLYIQRAMRNADYASYFRAHPLHAVTIDKNVFGSGQGGAGGGANLPAFPTDHFAEGDAYMQQEEYRYRRNQSEQRDFESALAVAHKTPIDDAKDPFQRRGMPDNPAEAPNPHATRSPLEHHVVLGVNQRLQPGPVPLSHDQLQAVMDYSRDVVNAIMGFPKGSTTSTAGKDKAAAESNNETRAWDDKVQGWIEQICEFFVEIYLAVYYQEHREYVNSVYKHIRRGGKELVRRGEVVDTSELPDDDIAGLLDEDETRKISDALKTRHKKNLKQLIADEIIPEFNIGYAPTATMQEFQALMNAMVINEDNFVEYVAMLYHIPPEKRMTKEEREKERADMEEQALHQQEEGMRMQAKYTPEKGPTKPGAPDGGVKPVSIEPEKMLHKGVQKPGAKNSGGKK